MRANNWVSLGIVCGCMACGTESSPLDGGVVDAPPFDAPSRQDSAPPPPSCAGQGGSAAVQEPVHLRNIKWTGTSWFASAAIVDLDNDGTMELVGAFYDLFVWDAEGNELARAESGQHHEGRIYAPAVIADLDGDGVMEIVVGAGKKVAAYEYVAEGLRIKSGWPQLAGREGESYEVRGLAGADLDGDGAIEIVATTTVDGDGSQVWVFSPNGALYQPAGLTAWRAWPRYNFDSGEGNDADANGMGHGGYGCYGLNVGVGNMDDDDELEIIVTYDNHHINAFNHDGTSITASSWYTNRDSDYADQPLDWGQFIRWLDPAVEDDHYHLHTGTWPHPREQSWLQWTASPPNVVDIDGDGKNEVVGVSNAERNVPYETVFEAVMVLEGDYASEDRSARRLAGWESLPHGAAPQMRPEGWYPPSSMPSPTHVDLDGDGKPETIFPSRDGHIYAINAEAAEMWSYDFRQGRPLLYATEVTVADLNRDGRPEVIFSTWGAPENPGAGYLVILDAAGHELFALQVPEQGDNGNGIGLPAAPALGDLDGDGELEIVLQSFEHGVDIYSVPGSGTACMLWPTGRANLLRNGQGPHYVR
ncbi:MAG: VCBS repeat-containing protein [Deltaproteobacteria bacterium]|nr:VCBS repeat-containing protein [Deltaproteobacteria bacterium]